MRFALFCTRTISFAVFTYDSAALEALFTVFDNVFTRFGMTIAEEKTGTMVFTDADTHESFIKLGNYQVKNVVNFSYLGCTRTNGRVGSMR